MRNEAILTTLFLLTPVVAQGSRLARAILIEEREHDLKRAVELYRELAGAEGANADERTRAQYRLGRALRLLGQEKAARRALAQAAKGTGAAAKSARRLLDGSTDAKAAQEKELRARARALLETGKAGFDELAWLGDAAIPEVIREYEAQWKKTGRPSYTSLLWHTSGKRARAYLEQALADEDGNLLAAIAQGVQQGGVHTSLLDVALDYMDCRKIDPALRLQLGNAVIGRAPLERLLALTEDRDPVMRSASWQLLNTYRSTRASTDTDREGFMVKVLPHLRKALEHPHAQVARAARQFLSSPPTLQTPTGRSLLLETVPRMQRTSFPTNMTGSGTFDGDDDMHVAEVLRLARHLGRYDIRDQRCRWLSWFLRRAHENWGPAATDTVIELVKLGYFAGQTRLWTDWLRNLSEPGLAHILASFAGSPRILDLAAVWHGSSRTRLTKAAWDSLRRCWPKLDDTARESDAADVVLDWMARANPAEAVPFLANLARTKPNLFEAATEALVGIRYDKRPLPPDYRDALRGILAKDYGPNPSETVRDMRQQVLDSLLALGDRQTFDELGRIAARDATLAITTALKTATRAYSAKRGTLDPQRLAAEWNAAYARKTKGWWEATYDILLGSATRSSTRETAAFLKDFNRIRNLDRVQPARLQILLPIATEKLSALLTEKPRKPLERWAWITLRDLLQSIGKLPDASNRLESELRKLERLCLASSEPKLQNAALVAMYERGPLPQQRQRIVSLIRSAHPAVSSSATEVVHRNVDLTEQEMTEILTWDGVAHRGQAIVYLLQTWKRRSAKTVLPLLEEPEEYVRLNACMYLGVCVDAAAVQPLLKTLRDPSAKVREAAANALRSIRFYHEQKAHWSRIAEGNRIDANSAAEALVRQSAAAEDKATRLLAIRSLGLLGAVETLPVLIDYTKETDAEIAGAARKAIEAVQVKAARK